MSGELVASRSSTLNVGTDLKAELERAARNEQRDATNLGRLLLREGLEARREAMPTDADAKVTRR